MAAGNGGEQRRTALITGASGGIGAELAGVFAANRCDLVLVARDEARLHAVGEALTLRWGIRYTAIAADLSAAGAVATLVGELERREIAVDVLINNAGFATYGQFKDLDLAGEMRMLQVNIVALTELTRRLLPGMAERRWGKILNVASTAAFMPGPLMAVYYASKAFVLSFSEAIGEELRGTGVTVTALCPGPTSTGFQARAGMEESKLVRDRAIMDAATVAREGYAALMGGRPIVVPGLKNRLQALVPKFLPRRLVPVMVRNAQERAH